MERGRQPPFPIQIVIVIRHLFVRQTVFREGAENCARGGRAPLTTSRIAFQAAGRPGTGTFCPPHRQPLPTPQMTGLFVPGVRPTVPVLRPTITARVKAVPARRPSVRGEAPAVPVKALTIPVTRPSVPEARPCVPVTRPTHIMLKSVELWDACVHFPDTGTSGRPVGRGSCRAQTSPAVHGSAGASPYRIGVVHGSAGASPYRIGAVHGSAGASPYRIGVGRICPGEGGAGAGSKLFSEKMQAGTLLATSLLSVNCRSVDRLSRETWRHNCNSRATQRLARGPGNKTNRSTERLTL